MRNVRNYLGYDENDKSHDDEIEKMKKDEILDKFLIWEGIIGYTQLIKKVVLEIYK